MNKKVSILLLAIISIITGLWIWSSLSTQNYVVLGGSTSVNTFMQSFTKDYLANEKKDFIYNSTGSQAGVGGVEKGMYGAGFISKDVGTGTLTGNNRFSSFGEDDKLVFLPGEATGFSEEMIDLKTHNNDIDIDKSYVAFEFALDAIVIIFKKPDWVTEETVNKINFDIPKNKTDESVLSKIYSNNYTWEELAKDAGQSDVPSSLTKIVTFTREDGSGTRSAFGDLTGIKKMETANVVNSNGSMFENIQKSQSAIGYISYAFIKQVTKESGVNVAGVNKTKLGNPANLGNDNWEFGMELNEQTKAFEKIAGDVSNEQFIKGYDGKEYKFKRPFISIFNTHFKKYELLIEFFSAMIGISKDENIYKENFVDEGLVQNFEIRKVVYEN
ncbi:phosphate ABC transporter substrate-binding protein [Spiroplasma tabanidicola]|uniref:Phosphate ABC transporter substrate-binding protein n=1 Tax=Spiroplasma tabanidicola TaxID=324079 RepID=A0A6I6CB94_9MOLU|nr:phosphate ABC transporter substrate-binding protein [Spiroplasma tabanidicola]QGS52215.1 phosphate ABC transporter substrate-binding protein [Spiroplasma tabanidicola]